MSRITLFADVLLPLPLPGLFTYRIPYEMNDSVQVGQRVIVQFGKKKIYTALIKNLHQKAPESYSVKYILSILDIDPIVKEIQFKLWGWISQYYLCNQGEVMNVALPSALKLASETKIIFNRNFDQDFSSLNENEYLIAEALNNRNNLTITEVAEITGQQKTFPLIKTLIEKNVVLLEEELTNKYKPKLETFVKLNQGYKNEDKLQQACDELNKRAYKQLELLLSYLNLSREFSEESVEVKRMVLLKSIGASAAQLKTLEKKGILETYKKETSRLKEYSALTNVESIELTPEQSKCFSQIKSAFEEKDVALLHGVTSSGKTEIYIKLISEYLKKGKQILYLLPEIALTTQIINRLRKYFGDRVGVYHSKYGKNERVEIWNRVLSAGNGNNSVEKTYDIILGARSSLFLPFTNLGLIIVDEEHDSSFKQFDPAPRYNARDSAIYLARLQGAKTILGTATPSVETYFNAKSGKYALIELSKRYGEMMLPEVIVVDLKHEIRRKKMLSHFSSVLIDYIKNALKEKQQIILFQNRRGFSLRIECETCNWMPECKNCDVTLTYHKHNNQLRCHYCGYSIRIPEKCPDCGSAVLLMKGFGTEKIEEELSLIFPEIRIVRMDLDTTRTKNALQQIINDFEDKRIDIIVGTQMVTKGLDFDNVGLVGILNADNMLNFPDFRSFERSYQLMAQVSGRAGRKNQRGKVIIQTYNPFHPIISNVIKNDYSAMFNSQLIERKKFRYPPYYRLIQVKLKHKNHNVLNKAAAELAVELRKVFGKRVLGPEYPLVSRIKNLYLKNILIKIEKESSVSFLKTTLKNQIEIFRAKKSNASVKVQIDVDPV